VTSDSRTALLVTLTLPQDQYRKSAPKRMGVLYER